MPVDVLIAWRPGCPHRVRALEHIQDRYAGNHPAWTVTLGSCPPGPWVKALAVAAALTAATAEILVIADADVWSDDLAAAVAAVEDGAAWAIPHRSVHRLTEDATSRVLAGASPTGMALQERAYRGVEGGGIVVLRRDTYKACPLDTRFEGWGSEDEAWGFALRSLFGAPWRPTRHAPLIHLFHPPQPRAKRSRGSLASWELRKRYARALNDPAAMTALIQEAHAHVPRGSAQPAGDGPAALNR